MKKIFQQPPTQALLQQKQLKKSTFLCISDSGLNTKKNTKGQGIYWSISPNQELPIKLSLQGFGQVVPEIIPIKFLELCAAKLNKVALRIPRYHLKIKEGEEEIKTPPDLKLKWQTWTFSLYMNDVLSFAKSLISLNIPPRSVVNINGNNAPEWFISQIGTIFSNCISVGVYSTNSPQASQSIAKSSNASVLVLQNINQLKKYLVRAEQSKKFQPSESQQSITDLENKPQAILTYRVIPGVKVIVIYAEDQKKLSLFRTKLPLGQIKLFTFTEFIQYHKNNIQDDCVIKTRVKPQQPGHVCNIVYTSGTSGQSKGAMLTHDNMLWPIGSLVSTFAQQIEITDDQRQLSYLPLSHIASQSFDIMGQMFHAATITFPPSQRDMEKKETAHQLAKKYNKKSKLQDDQRISGVNAVLTNQLPELLRECRPTIFLGVPRVWEKASQLIKRGIGKRSQLSKVLIGIARQRSHRATINKIQFNGNSSSNSKKRKFQTKPQNPFGYFFTKKLFIEPMQKIFGLQCAKFLISAAAPLKKETLLFFQTLNMPILNIFGLSQTSGAMTFNSPYKQKLFSAGIIVPGSHLKIYNPDPNNVGELCVKGRGIFQGYFNDISSTCSAIDKEGYLHTGDEGYIDEEGFVTITGRLKDLIITAGGQNVAPKAIQDRIKQNCKIISHALVVGDGKKFLTAILTLKTLQEQRGELSGSGRNIQTNEGNFVLFNQQNNKLSSQCIEILRADQIDSLAQTIHQARSCPKVTQYINKCMNEYVNKNAISRAQEVRKWVILPNEFTVHGGEITPTGKVKRKVIEKKYQVVIDSMYLIPHI